MLWVVQFFQRASKSTTSSQQFESGPFRATPDPSEHDTWSEYDEYNLRDDVNQSLSDGEYELNGHLHDWRNTPLTSSISSGIDKSVACESDELKLKESDWKPTVSEGADMASPLVNGAMVELDVPVSLDDSSAHSSPLEANGTIEIGELSPQKDDIAILSPPGTRETSIVGCNARGPSKRCLMLIFLEILLFALLLFWMIAFGRLLYKEYYQPKEDVGALCSGLKYVDSLVSTGFVHWAHCINEDNRGFVDKLADEAEHLVIDVYKTVDEYGNRVYDYTVKLGKSFTNEMSDDLHKVESTLSKALGAAGDFLTGHSNKTINAAADDDDYDD
ncbi:hypothetical protein AB6A40_007270 [Gnathostoma spinigerum]|uniref:Uncharacterized protein n=1 Tax=Gnathostoma spinigerum TaxID=75299 RepID=A0ABD6ESX5_9BILA